MLDIYREWTSGHAFTSWAQRLSPQQPGKLTGTPIRHTLTELSAADMGQTEG